MGTLVCLRNRREQPYEQRGAVLHKRASAWQPLRSLHASLEVQAARRAPITWCALPAAKVPWSHPRVIPARTSSIWGSMRLRTFRFICSAARWSITGLGCAMARVPRAAALQLA